jgi:Domain of unknown function (DUF4136)
MRTRHLLTTGLLIALAAPVALEGAKIQSQRDEKFDFTTINTFAWNPAGAGDIKVWLTGENRSEPVKKKYEPVIMQAIEEQFSARGYKRASGYRPDFTITYMLLVTTGSSSQYAGQFLPTNAQWGIPMFAPATTSLTVYPQGTLVLDASSDAAKGMIWRGMAEAKIEAENTDEKRVKRINSIVKELLAKFPKKKT